MSQANVSRLMSAARVHWHMRMLPVLSLQDGLGQGPLLILAPHPDDETLGCGGLIGTACAAGLKVFVLVLTDGAGSHPRSRAYPPARLQRLREAESRAAGRMLGLGEAHISFLGLPDTRAPVTGHQADKAVEAIAALARSCAAKTILTSWRHDPHCDHVAASRLAARAAAIANVDLYEYPVWGWTLPPRRLLPAEPVSGFRLDVSAHLANKRRAIACHQSQLGEIITDDPEGFKMERQFVDLFIGKYETFLHARPECG